MLQKFKLSFVNVPNLVLCSDRARLCHSDTGLGRCGVRTGRWTLS